VKSTPSLPSERKTRGKRPFCPVKAIEDAQIGELRGINNEKSFETARG